MNPREYFLMSNPGVLTAAQHERQDISRADGLSGQILNEAARDQPSFSVIILGVLHNLGSIVTARLQG